jgi:serine protease Do
VRFPRLPDWLVYATVVAAILFASLGRKDDANAPAPPPPVPGAAQMPLAASSPFAPARLAALPAKLETASGTAFSVAESGVWLTARHVLDGCRQSAIVVAPGRGVAAHLRAERGDVAVLTTEGGSPALPIAVAADVRDGEQAFHPGFPQGGPGEATSRLLGPQTLRARSRSEPPLALLAWAEVGRTDKLKGTLAGLSGAPALDSEGRVVGVTLAEAPRRGRIYTTTPQAVREALAAARLKPAAGAAGQTITSENYGRAADALRRDVRVAQVVCLAA